MDKDTHILLNHKKEWNLAVYNNMNGPRGNNAEWNKSVRERQISWFHSYVKFKKLNKWTKRKRDKQKTSLLNTDNKLVVARRGISEGMGEIDKGD